jgi:CBS domain containing-hemolysin-like protein
MTPRVDVKALEALASAADAVNLTHATGLSRFPVYRDSLDEAIGTVHIRDVLALDEDKRAGTPVTDLMTPPLLVPDSLPVDTLLARMRTERIMAVVIDEYGGTAGVATVEDIIEEVVGRPRHRPFHMSPTTGRSPATPGWSRRCWATG